MASSSSPATVSSPVQLVKPWLQWGPFPMLLKCWAVQTSHWKRSRSKLFMRKGCLCLASHWIWKEHLLPGSSIYFGLQAGLGPVWEQDHCAGGSSTSFDGGSGKYRACRTRILRQWSSLLEAPYHWGQKLLGYSFCSCTIYKNTWSRVSVCHNLSWWLVTWPKWWVGKNSRNQALPSLLLPLSVLESLGTRLGR